MLQHLVDTNPVLQLIGLITQLTAPHYPNSVNQLVTPRNLTTRYYPLYGVATNNTTYYQHTFESH